MYAAVHNTELAGPENIVGEDLVRLTDILNYIIFLGFNYHGARSRVAPDIRPFLISGIRPDIRFHLPDIRLEELFLN